MNGNLHQYCQTGVEMSPTTKMKFKRYSSENTFHRLNWGRENVATMDSTGTMRTRTRDSYLYPSESDLGGVATCYDDERCRSVATVGSR